MSTNLENQSTVKSNYHESLFKYCKYICHGNIYIWHDIIIKYSCAANILEFSTVPGMCPKFPLFNIMVDRSNSCSLKLRYEILSIMLTGMQLIDEIKRNINNESAVKYYQQLNIYLDIYIWIFASVDKCIMNVVYDVYMLRKFVKIQQEYINNLHKTLSPKTNINKKRSFDDIQTGPSSDAIVPIEKTSKTE